MTVRWRADDRATAIGTPARDTGPGLFVADLTTAVLSAGAAATLAFHWSADDRREGDNFTVAITELHA
jgi:hypothetical protein